MLKAVNCDCSQVNLRVPQGKSHLELPNLSQFTKRGFSVQHDKSSIHLFGTFAESVIFVTMVYIYI